MKYLFFLLVLIGCKNRIDKKTSEKYQDINNYYKNELSAQVPDNGIVIILQNQQCSACRKGVFQKLAAKLDKNTLPKTFILASLDTSLTNIIRKIPNSKVQIDDKHKVKDYGLDYAADLFFLFNGNQLEKWFELSNENVEQFRL